MICDAILPSFEPQTCPESTGKSRLIKTAWKTPLFSLLLSFSRSAQVTLVQDNDTSPYTSEERENLDIIQRSGEHLLTLINQVLDLSKIEDGRITLNEKNFDLHYLLDGLNEMFSLKAQRKSLHLL